MPGALASAKNSKPPVGMGALLFLALGYALLKIIHAGTSVTAAKRSSGSTQIMRKRTGTLRRRPRLLADVECADSGADGLASPAPTVVLSPSTPIIPAEADCCSTL